MAGCYKKIYGLTGFLVLFAWLTVPLSELTADDKSGTSVKSENFIAPQYSADGERLQYIIYGESAENIGAFVSLKNPIFSIMADQLDDYEFISPQTGLKFYPLSADESEISSFWTGKEPFSALISSKNATYDKTTGILTGNDEVHFRSREIDVDGVGFEVYHDKKLIHIRKDVKMVIRPVSYAKYMKKEFAKPDEEIETENEQETAENSEGEISAAGENEP